ncbi:MAG: ABC transporter permease [Armatimonadetes bacterium]|nr:ABC transporter permease [Armatimonadota bacterium]
MSRYTLYRLGQSALTIVGVSILVFMFLHLAPGDPAALIAGPQASEADLQVIRATYGFDDPLPVQYWRWLARILRGDFGYSHRAGQPVGADIARAFPISLTLACGGLLVAVAVGIPLGMTAAIHREGAMDLTVMGLAVAGMSMPVFWLALLMILLFALRLGWLPSSGWDSLRHYILPIFSVSLASLALISRMTRSIMIEVLLEDYVRTARAKGVRERAVFYRHALRNALLPIVTVVGLRFSLLVSGAVVTETVFAVPGLGRLIVLAVSSRDFPVVQGGVLVISVAISMANLIVDLLYATLDPRIRYE